MRQFTKSQQNVIDYRGKKILVSASAGTGKTTVMIERIATLIAEGADVSEFVVVTFTNLAAAEMKKRLYEKLSEKSTDRRIAEQLEKLDNAAICTIDSFCSDLLRNYFYVVDIDPSFTVLDAITVSNLRKNAFDEVFKEYFKCGDETFTQVYQIFASKRRRENFTELLSDIYNFSRCLPNFSEWYEKKRENYLNLDRADNPIVSIILSDICQNADYFQQAMSILAEKSDGEHLDKFTEVFHANERTFAEIPRDNLQGALWAISNVKFVPVPTRTQTRNYEVDTEFLRVDFEELKDRFKKIQEKYTLLCRGESAATLFAETEKSVQYVDKIVEILGRFDRVFFDLKKQRGGVDFGDLEHLALAILSDEEAAKAIHERYKLVFVDEYQDINPLQEALISRLAQQAQLFVVGDIKQSIYGFRGCEPAIFLEKYNTFRAGQDGCVEELNENFRSNKQILHFVNDVFGCVMTENFGKVNYAKTAQLQGNLQPDLMTEAVQVDLVVQSKEEKSEASEIYDITAPQQDSNHVSQGRVIAQNICSFVGMAYKDKNGEARRIQYGDIVVLVRGMTNKTIAVYNALVEQNIPVVANFKQSGYANKEVRDLVNLMRAMDNPYNDIYTVGACLAPFGGFTENDLAQIKIATMQERAPFFNRMQMYVGSAQNDALSDKIDAFLTFLEELRFYSRSSTVDQIVLEVLRRTHFHLYVQGLPNGALRLRKMYDFIDELHGATYAQSVEKFLAFLDEVDEFSTEECSSDINAVRIMTMHASKGLEFPVVIVAGTESGFNIDYPAVECNNSLGIATKYYNFSNMRVAHTLGEAACGMYNRIRQREEEMRLLYVALTRAKLVLNVVGVVEEKQLFTMPKRASEANSHLDWILTALKMKFGNLEVADGVNIVRTPEHTEAQIADVLCEQCTDMQRVEEQLNYRYPYADQIDMPSKVVSSALDKEYIDIDPDRAEFVLEQNNDRNALGTAYHKVYQYAHFGATKQDVEQVVVGLVNEGKIDPLFAEKLDIDLIFQTLNNEELKKLVHGGEVYHEMPFMLYAPYDQIVPDKRFSDDVMLQGVIDLLILSCDKKHATVVDFKYSTHSAERLKKSYVAQLASYRLAVRQICGIEDVDCYILSIEQNKLIAM